MFEWAREQPEFEINMQNLRDEKFRNEDDLEKFAFFQLFEKVKDISQIILWFEIKYVS